VQSRAEVTKKKQTNKKATLSLFVWNTHPHRDAHLVVHCGLGIGLAAGKCCAERIS
jgi:hypothetical protein